MNEMDLLTQFRAEVPLPPAAAPQAEHRLTAAILSSERPVPPGPGMLSGQRARRRRLRLAIAVPLAAGVAAAAAVVATAGSAPQPLTVRLLADRASAAALDQPAVDGGKWFYRVTMWHMDTAPRTVTLPSPGASPSTVVIPNHGTQTGWETADGLASWGAAGTVSGGGGETPSYAQLGSLPTDPAALDAYLAHLSYPDPDATQTSKDVAAFTAIQDMLLNYVLPPAFAAELYQALADIPTVRVQSGVTDIAGRAGVAFVLPETSQSADLEVILDASDYAFLAQAAWEPSNGTPDSAIPFTEFALVKSIPVAGPGSTGYDASPPAAAQVLAEHGYYAAMHITGGRPLGLPAPGQWVYRQLKTASGDRQVWATADDATQAEAAGGTMQTCSRLAACAASTSWLMPAGPAYALINIRAASGPPPYQTLPHDDLGQLLTVLNSYHTGCTDTAGDCDAVTALANTLTGYAIPPGEGAWWLALATVPGVTVQHITDAAGRADDEFVFPYSDGVTGILLDASTYEFAGYVKDGAQTLLLKQADVSGPGVLPGN